MPWSVTTVEENRRNLCEQVMRSGVSMGQACRAFGISRKTGYKWLRRFRKFGEDGLHDSRRRPHSSPWQAPAELETLVLQLKRTYPYWGPRKLHRLLYIDHPEAPRVGISTVGRILARHGLVIPREAPVTYPTVERFERSEANDLWQMDLKLVMTLPDGTEWYVAGILDDHSRFVLGLWWLPDLSESTVLSCWIDAARRFGLPRQTLTDHGAQFRMVDGATSAFRTYLWACGVSHLQGRVKHPQTQGKIERFWQTLNKELTPQLQRADRSYWPELMERWRGQYNTRRPHESLADDTPDSRYRHSDRPFAEPDRRARIGQPGSIYRSVSPRGRISLAGRRVMIGRGLAQWTVEVRPLGNGCWHVYFRHHFLREFILAKQPKCVTHVPIHLLPMS